MQSTKKQITATSYPLSGVVDSIQRAFFLVIRLLPYTVRVTKDLLEMGLFSTKCMSTARLDGKTALITGSNTGIGKVTAKDFFQRGARVIMACRNLEAGNEALEDIKKECENCQNCGELRVTKLDLSSLVSVRKCAEHLIESEDKINLLINNAGVMMCPLSRTEDGFEMQFGTNHLGHFLLTLLLLPKIIQSKPARIVTVSSMAHLAGKIDFADLNWEKKPYSSWGAYEQSKLANILFSAELARRLKEINIEGVNTYSLHPGVISTDLGRHLRSTVTWSFWRLTRIFRKTPEQGAQTTIYCALDEKCENETGLYYTECKVMNPSNEAKNQVTAKRLWETSCELVKLDKNYNPFQQLK